MGEGREWASRVSASRSAALLCVTVLHIGAWCLAGLRAPAHNQVSPVAGISANVIMFRMVREPAPHAEAGESAKPKPIVKPRRWNERHSVTPRPDNVPLKVETRTSPATLDETQEATSAKGVPDSETVKRVIADFVAEERKNDHRPVTTLTSRRSATEKAIGAAFRPRCSSDDAAQLGNVRLTGLMRLPALLRGVISDEGCKW